MFDFNTFFSNNQLSFNKYFQKPINASINQINLLKNYINGLNRYTKSYLDPFLDEIIYFSNAESEKLIKSTPEQNFDSYVELVNFSTDIILRGFLSAIKSVFKYNESEMDIAVKALFNTFSGNMENDFFDFIERQNQIVHMLANEFPKAIKEIESEYGFHFEKGYNKKIAETDRFYLYQILPSDNKIEVNKNGKPLIIIPPFVLGSNILGFLPNEKRSYAHSYANAGIPTYIRVMKNIHENEAVQVMTPDDDAVDTRFFCEKVKEINGKPVTLNGYCQGGFSVICDVLSGKLDNLVDAIITCVSPMDGTKSDGLGLFLKKLPKRFNILEYGLKRLSNGNIVIDGDLMGWVYKIKAIENEFPVSAFYRDLKMFIPKDNKPVKINKSAAAINYWLGYERSDLPLAITQMSFDSYNIPITDDGTLPVKLFGKKLNLKRIKEKNIPWLICYGENDDLVEKQTALAPLDYIDVEVSAFPRGHVAIATSWSKPDSACALHKVFGDKKYRGPVKFQLDIDKNKK